MATTLILQSCSARQQQSWQGQCLATVQAWAIARGFDYRFVDDAIFAVVPQWYLDKVGPKLPVATDYARLVLLQAALREGYAEVVWLDADVLVLDLALQLEFTGSCAFGQEVWVQQQAGRLRARSNIHNAVCAFRPGCPVLPFLIHSIESLIRRVDPAHIAPQLAGPKLLQALHPLCDFALLPGFGALSPAVVADLLAGDGPALRLLRAHSPQPPQALNLCASLLPDPALALQLVLLLRERGAGWMSAWQALDPGSDQV
jgi:hypothetical protein